VNPKAASTASPGDLSAPQLATQLAALQDAKVEEWVRLIRFGGTIPLAVERSLSWRLTRPVRLAETAMLVLRRDGANRFWATVFYRLRRLVTRK
jgi:hypothetical protein